MLLVLVLLLLLAASTIASTNDSILDDPRHYVATSLSLASNRVRGHGGLGSFDHLWAGQDKDTRGLKRHCSKTIRLR